MKKAAAIVSLSACLWLIAAGITGNALAQSSPADQPPPIVVASFLSFSDTQAAQFGELLSQFQGAIVTLQQQIAARQRRLEILLNESSPNLGAIGQLVVEIHALNQQAAHTEYNFREQFVGILTQQQKERFEAAATAARLQPVVGAFVALHLVPVPSPPR